MNSDQLHYLIELSKSPSINLASQKLHITPQALSTAIKKLETELGFLLLDRSFKGVSLTENGQWLVRESSQFLDKIEERKRGASVKEQGHHGTLDLAINYSGISSNILAQLICLLYQKEPQLSVSLKETSKDNVLFSVNQADTELGFIYRTKLNGQYIDTLEYSLTFEPIFCGDLILLTAPTSKLAKSKSTTLKNVCQYPICSYNPQIDSKDLIHCFITDTLHLSAQFSYENNFALYKEKILHGIANALSVFFTIEDSPNNYIPNSKIVNLRDDIKIYFGYVKKKDFVLSENAAFFVQELKKHIQFLKYQKTE